MDTKIIPYYARLFKQKKSAPLTLKMVTTLLAAYKKQKAAIPFGHSDIRGSFIALIKRDLIVRKKTFIDGSFQDNWQVTNEAINLLKNSGIAV